jgi:hypothetical protein
MIGEMGWSVRVDFVMVATFKAQGQIYMTTRRSG